MDIASITVADGLALTGSGIEAWFAKLTGHQVTALDFAESFNWGVDLPLGGFGILAARHINGHLLDARYFLDGNDSEAIQAAVGFASATSEASGVIFLSKIPGPAAAGWNIDATVTLASNVTVLGDPHGTRFDLNVAAPVFTIPTGSANIVIQNIKVDTANQQTADFVSCAGTMDGLVVDNCSVGTRGTSSEFLDGYIVKSAGVLTRGRITRNRCYGGGCIASLAGAAEVIIEDNRIEGTIHSSANVSATIGISVTSGSDVKIRNNYIYGWETGGADLSRAILLDTCQGVVVSGNETWGCNLSAVKVDGGSRIQIFDNTFLSGATGGVGSDDAILWLTGGAAVVEVHDNVISGYGPTAGTIPIACSYCMAVGNGVLYGALCQDISVWSNIFSTITSAGSFPVVGDIYRSSAAAGTLYLSPALLRCNAWDNTYFVNQRYFDAYADQDGGAAGGSAVIATPGFSGSLLNHMRLIVTSTGDAVYVSAMAADTITITNYDGSTALTGGDLYFHFDG